MMRLLHTLREDHLLRKVLKNSSYLFSSNAAAAVLSMLQGIMAARLLGAANYGILAAAIIPFVSDMNRLLSFRMSEVVVKYLSQALEAQEKMRGAAVVKAAGIVDILSSLLAFLLLIWAAPFASQFFAKDIQTAPWFVTYGIVLLANSAYETSLGVLQTARRFNRIAQANLLHNAVTVTMIAIAYFTQGGVLQVLLAYLAGKACASMALAVMAIRQLYQDLGAGWWKVSLRQLPPWRELGRFALSTNLQGTVNLIVRDSEGLFISALRSPAEAGYFKIALGVINLVMMPIEPFISTIYTEMSHMVAQRAFSSTRRLLKRVSLIAGGWTALAGGGLILLGHWLIPFMYGDEYRPAYPAMILLLVGYSFANIVNWNRPLLLALGQPAYPLKASALVGVIKTSLTLTLVKPFGYLAEAAILSGYLAASISLILRKGLRELNRQQSVDVIQEA
jgi:O-antigen/teichoic acid export membrane protein